MIGQAGFWFVASEFTLQTFCYRLFLSSLRFTYFFFPPPAGNNWILAITCLILKNLGGIIGKAGEEPLCRILLYKKFGFMVPVLDYRRGSGIAIEQYLS